MPDLTPSDAFDELAAQELQALAAILNDSGKSVCVMAITVDDDEIIGLYAASRVKPSARAAIVQGFREEIDNIEARWRA